jgi:hypothetical protein
MNSQPLSPVEQKVYYITVDSQTNRWINRAEDASNESAKMGGERRLEVESRSMPCDGGPEAAAQQVRRGGQLKSSEEGGRSR